MVFIPHTTSTKHAGSWSTKAWGNVSVYLLRLKISSSRAGPQMAAPLPTCFPSQLSTCQPVQGGSGKSACSPLQLRLWRTIGLVDMQLLTAFGFLNFLCGFCLHVCLCTNACLVFSSSEDVISPGIGVTEVKSHHVSTGNETKYS